jgi:hypothetical protein
MLFQMMTDRLFHNGAYNSMKYLANWNKYFYLFKQATLNVLPIDPVWRDEKAIPVNEKETFTFKDLGVSHGDDVRVFILVTVLSSFFFIRFSCFFIMKNHVFRQKSKLPTLKYSRDSIFLRCTTLL